MARCLVLLLQVTEQGIAVERGADGLDFLPARELPPMTLPQALLPEGARFVGVGTLGEDDAYLFLLRGGRARRARPRAAVLDGGSPGRTGRFFDKIHAPQLSKLWKMWYNDSTSSPPLRGKGRGIRV